MAMLALKTCDTRKHLTVAISRPQNVSIWVLGKSTFKLQEVVISCHFRTHLSTRPVSVQLR